MNIKSLLSKITFRGVMRAFVSLLMGIEFGYFALNLYLGKNLEALPHFNQGMWMGIALFFEARAHQLRTQNRNLQNFLDNPGGVQ